MVDDSMPTWNSSPKARKLFEYIEKKRKGVGVDENERSIGGSSPPMEDLVWDNGITTQSNSFLHVSKGSKGGAQLEQLSNTNALLI